MALRTLLLLGLAFAGTACAEGFDFEALRTLIEARQVRSVEALLPLLPAGLRYRYALVFASRSLQGASYASPRVVLYGTDARLVLTFNGAPGQRGFGSIETLEFDEAARAFRLREIGFPADAAGAVTVSQVDPPRCTRCHGSPARPVWDTHPAWPGAYGERYGAALSPAERAGIDAFLAAQPAHPRYRHLLGAERFADPDTFRPDARSRYGGSPAEPPNAELSGLFGTLAARATVRELAAREGFAAYRYALLGASDLACGRLDDFFPAASARPVAAALRDFEAVTAAANAREREFKALRLGTGTPPSRPADDAALTPLRFLAESALGLRSRGWTLALEKGSYDFTLPPAAAGAMRRALLEEIAPAEPALAELAAYSTPADGDRYCNFLRRRSRAALAGRAPPGPPLPEAAPPGLVAADRPAALGLCIACHQSDVAPPIAFADEAELARALRGEAPGAGPGLAVLLFRLSPQAGARRMPLGINLPEPEREALAAYFRSLAAPAQASEAAGSHRSGGAHASR